MGPGSNASILYLCVEQNPNFGGAYTFNHGRAFYLMAIFRAFAAHQVTAIAAMTLNFAAAGHFDSFGQPFMGFLLWHISSF